MPADRLSAARKTSPQSRRRRRPSTRNRTNVPAATAEQDGRERILAVAIRAFSEVGYEGTTTAGIARDAGVTQPLVHHHFGSKEGLWRAAMDALFANVPSVIARAAGEPPPDSLLAIVEGFVRWVAAHPEVTRVIARTGATPSPRLDHLVQRYLREPLRQVAEVVRAGQRAGVIAPDVRPDLLLFLILGAGSHLFDVKAFAQRSLGIDVTAPGTRDQFVALVRMLLERGLFHGTREAPA